MNASKILQQLMSQASGSKGSSGGMDVKGVIDGLSRHLGGNSSQGTRQSSGSSGFDVKSLLGGGALGMLVGSKRGRSMGGKALKYGAIAGVGMESVAKLSGKERSCDPILFRRRTCRGVKRRGSRAPQPGTAAGDDHGRTGGWSYR